MGYRVEYGQVRSIRGAEKCRVRRFALTVLFLLLFLRLVQTFWPEGREILRGIFVPGQPEITLTALETLALELRQGQPLSEAFGDFVGFLMEGEALVPG